jgi:hypothetical protein
MYVQRRASAGGLYVEDARPLAARAVTEASQTPRRCINADDALSEVEAAAQTA